MKSLDEVKGRYAEVSQVMGRLHVGAKAWDAIDEVIREGYNGRG